MRIGIIGVGSMGRILARHLGKLGHHISIANSRGPESLTALAAEIEATPVSVVDAARAAESMGLDAASMHHFPELGSGPSIVSKEVIMFRRRMHNRFGDPIAWGVATATIASNVMIGSLRADGTGICNAFCVGDINYDGMVDGADMGILLADWGPSFGGSCADLDGCGSVDGADLGILLGHWGECPVPLCPASEHDCRQVGKPGCSDVGCCDIVCAIDPFCCLESWDQSCVESALQLCD